MATFTFNADDALPGWTEEDDATLVTDSGSINSQVYKLTETGDGIEGSISQSVPSATLANDTYGVLIRVRFAGTAITSGSLQFSAGTPGSFAIAPGDVSGTTWAEQNTFTYDGHEYMYLGEWTYSGGGFDITIDGPKSHNDSMYFDRLILTTDDLTTVAVSPTPAAATATATSPSASQSSLTLQPGDPATADTSGSATAAQSSISIAPDTAAAATDAVTPSVTYGAVAVNPSAATGHASGMDPSVQLTSSDVSPAAAAAWTAGQEPVVDSSSITVSAAAAQVIAAAEVPSVLLGAISFGPASATAVTAAENPGIGVNDIDVTPAAAQAIVNAEASSVLLGSISVGPAPAAALTSAESPAIGANDVDVTPAAAATIATSSQPVVVQGSLAITAVPATLQTSTTDPAIAMSAMTVVPATAGAISAASSPDVSEGALVVAPDVASITATAQTPQLVLGDVAITPNQATAIATAPMPGVVEGGDITISPGVAAATQATAETPTLLIRTLSRYVPISDVSQGAWVTGASSLALNLVLDDATYIDSSLSPAADAFEVQMRNIIWPEPTWPFLALLRIQKVDSAGNPASDGETIDLTVDAVNDGVVIWTWNINDIQATNGLSNGLSVLFADPNNPATTPIDPTAFSLKVTANASGAGAARKARLSFGQFRSYDQFTAQPKCLWWPCICTAKNLTGCNECDGLLNGVPSQADVTLDGFANTVEVTCCDFNNTSYSIPLEEHPSVDHCDYTGQLALTCGPPAKPSVSVHVDLRTGLVQVFLKNRFSTIIRTWTAQMLPTPTGWVCDVDETDFVQDFNEPTIASGECDHNAVTLTGFALS